MHEATQIVNAIPGIPGPQGPEGPPSTIAERLIKTYTASENISAMKLLYLISATEVAVASSDNLNTSMVVGIALNSASLGGDVEVLMFGIIQDVFFTFAVNSFLFLSSNGSITDVAPSVGQRVLVGKGLGSGVGFIKIEEPITL